MSAVRRYGLPEPVPTCRRLPPLCLFPGQTRAQDAKWAEVGKRVMSMPVSASTFSAVRRPTPGISSSIAIAGSKGIASSTLGLRVRLGGVR